MRRRRTALLLLAGAIVLAAGIVLAREPDPELVTQVTERLSQLLGQEVVPHVRVEPALLGGVVIRVGERDAVRARLTGFDRHLVKPVGLSALQHVLYEAGVVHRQLAGNC